MLTTSTSTRRTCPRCWRRQAPKASRSSRRLPLLKATAPGRFAFIAECDAHGAESRPEGLVVGGESHASGVHAKYLAASSGTTPETSTSLPAPGLSVEQQLAGEHFVDECLLALHLRE